jgi:hypothetical protein
MRCVLTLRGVAVHTLAHRPSPNLKVNLHQVLNLIAAHLHDQVVLQAVVLMKWRQRLIPCRMSVAL